MNTITKRLAQMTAIYAAKTLWNQVDQDAAREMMGQLYRSAPRDWQMAAKRAAGEGFDTMRSQAVVGMDDVLNQVGLMRSSQIPTRRMSGLGMGLVGGVALGVAGGYFLFRTEAGETLRRRIEETLKSSDEELETAEHDMAGETVIQDPDAMDEPSARAATTRKRRVPVN